MSDLIRASGWPVADQSTDAPLVEELTAVVQRTNAEFGNLVVDVVDQLETANR